MVIYLIRHARQNSTDCNVNVPLSAEGRRQAELLGKRMNKYKIDALYSSDLIRAVETAKIAFKDRKELSDNIIIRPGIAEIDFGSLTGVHDSEVKRFYKEEGHIRLQPENSTMSPIIVRDVKILGTVKGVFRYFN